VATPSQDPLQLASKLVIVITIGGGDGCPTVSQLVAVQPILSVTVTQCTPAQSDEAVEEV
jgi:hypothetical protein